MCCLCVSSGKHPQHPVVRTMASTVMTHSQFNLKIKEQDAEMKYLVSARSEAVALLSRKNYSF